LLSAGDSKDQMRQSGGLSLDGGSTAATPYDGNAIGNELRRITPRRLCAGDFLLSDGDSNHSMRQSGGLSLAAKSQKTWSNIAGVLMTAPAFCDQTSLYINHAPSLLSLAPFFGAVRRITGFSAEGFRGTSLPFDTSPFRVFT